MATVINTFLFSAYMNVKKYRITYSKNVITLHLAFEKGEQYISYLDILNLNYPSGETVN